MGAIDELLARHEAGHATPGTTGAEPLESPRPRLRVTVLWQPVSSRRLESALRDLLPRRLCALSDTR